MSTHQTAKTQYIEVKGTRYAYRYFGLFSSSNPPLVFLQHFRGTMDHWDPLLINALAKTRPIILLDNSGVGKSSGTIPDNFAAWAANVIDVIAALKIPKIDLLGFSMGGNAAQMVALDAPQLVRRLILAGTGPSAGEGTEYGDGRSEASKNLGEAGTEEEAKAAFLATFYSQSEEKLALGLAWWKRIHERSVEERSDYVSGDGVLQQVKAMVRWKTGEPGGSFERLGEIKIPVFVASGDDDIVVPTANSIALWRNIKTAHLHIYPDVGHGFLNEYVEMFAEHVRIFLDAERVV